MVGVFVNFFFVIVTRYYVAITFYDCDNLVKKLSFKLSRQRSLHACCIVVICLLDAVKKI